MVFRSRGDLLGEDVLVDEAAQLLRLHFERAARETKALDGVRCHDHMQVEAAVRRRLAAGVNRANEPARALYAGAGYEQTGADERRCFLRKRL